jgi:hypothetical protein
MGVLTDLATMGTEGAFGDAAKRALTKKRADGSADAPDSGSSGSGGGGVLGDIVSGITKIRGKKRSNGKSRGSD